jgi:hypothetical protein
MLRLSSKEGKEFNQQKKMPIYIDHPPSLRP